ncbi:hypothetical protein C8Q74DRAFT_953423 [Fomes fomentarius]|nr:hypothetical protein C8Q74DRAFT_953423 [Fomes fomentarius]
MRSVQYVRPVWQVQGRKEAWSVVCTYWSLFCSTRFAQICETEPERILDPDRRLAPKLNHITSELKYGLSSIRRRQFFRSHSFFPGHLIFPVASTFLQPFALEIGGSHHPPPFLVLILYITYIKTLSFPSSNARSSQIGFLVALGAFSIRMHEVSSPGPWPPVQVHGLPASQAHISSNTGTYASSPCHRPWRKRSSTSDLSPVPRSLRHSGYLPRS